MPTYYDKVFYVYPDSKQPERARIDGVYCNLFYQFSSYGEAWMFLLENHIRRIEEYKHDDKN